MPSLSFSFGSNFFLHVQNQLLTFVANLYVCKVETFKSLTRKHIYVPSWTVQSLTAVLQSHIYEHQRIREPRKGNLRIFQHHNMWKSNTQISKACRMQINFHTSIPGKNTYIQSNLSTSRKNGKLKTDKNLFRFSPLLDFPFPSYLPSTIPLLLLPYFYSKY